MKNSKFKIRNAKQAQISKSKIKNTFGHLNLGFVCDLEFWRKQ
jgi:hypothetical protein